MGGLSSRSAPTPGRACSPVVGRCSRRPCYGTAWPIAFFNAQLSANGKQALNQYVPQLQSLHDAKVVVYGYTDNLPVGGPLKRAGPSRYPSSWGMTMKSECGQ